MSERIDHTEAARVNLRAATECPISEGTAAYAAIAQVHATLALAEQQRVATLVQLGMHDRSSIVSWSGSAVVVQTKDIKAEMASAPGIDEGIF